MRKLPVGGRDPASSALLLLQAQTTPDFTREIQPIFEKNCYACHGETQSAASVSSTALGGFPRRSRRFTRRVAGAEGVARMPMGGCS